MEIKETLKLNGQDRQNSKDIKEAKSKNKLAQFGKRATSQARSQLVSWTELRHNGPAELPLGSQLILFNTPPWLAELSQRPRKSYG